ncbi:hypothetical protein BDV36DRAFT_269710 [Aspergillus pseudocaelatus]|uniref:Uncharacterized protein n=1 Tax=Aspergillus pseudocaelatus TaxID=1825620 RepID=A0ABQ6W8T7_9EURO|nr:hypothetical protein BDV36DRAFT_269710 [Aspergillus pseudocaelatus]
MRTIPLVLPLHLLRLRSCGTCTTLLESPGQHSTKFQHPANSSPLLIIPLLSLTFLFFPPSFLLLLFFFF